MYRFIVAICLVIVMTACDRGQEMMDPVLPSVVESPVSRDITIGVVLPQTGNLGPGEFGPGALVMENGFNMALEEINASGMLGGAMLTFIVEDDMSSVEGAVSAFNKLIHEDKVPVILGVWTSQVAQSVFPIAQANEVVAFSPVVIASGLADIGDFIFRASHSTDVLIPQGVKLTQAKLSYQRVATLVDSADLFSRDSDAALRKALTARGIEVLATETFATGETDFTPHLTRIKALSPDAVFVSAQQIEVIHILRQGHGLGMPADIPFISPVLSIDEVQKAGAAAEGAITFTDWVSTSETPGNSVFVRNYTAKYGMEPSVWAAQPYAAVYILAEAISKAASTDAAAIAAALSEIKDFNTILGSFSFDLNGEPVYDPVVLIVKDGRLEVFE